VSPKTSLLVTTAIAGCLLSSAAFAQSVSPPPPPAAKPAPAAIPQDNAIGEIIVTAEKREQSLQQVPVAISAFTAEKRDLLGINSIVDQTNYTPGLTYTAGNDRLSLRGIGRLTNAHTADSGAAIYVDGAFTTSTIEAGRSPLYVERTEVLRGPQGTLYGRNAIGGAFNTITKHPTRDYSGEIRINYGNYDRVRVDSAVSIPFTDSLRGKVGFSYNYQGQGFIKNTVPGADSVDGRRNEKYFEAQLEGEIGKFDFWLFYEKNIWDNSAAPGGPTGGSLVPPNSSQGNGAFPSASYCFNGALNCSYVGAPGNPALTTGNLYALTEDTPFKNQLHGNDIARTHLTYHFDNFDVKYVGSFLRYDYKYEDDTDGSGVQSYQVPLNPLAGPIAVVGGRPVNCYVLQAFGACKPATVYFGTQNTYEEDEELYSHEINIVSTNPGPLQYVAGVYFYHEKFQYPQNVYAPNQPQIATPIYPTGAAAPADPTRNYAHTNVFSSVSSKAVFGQIDYKITDTLKLTGGLRYTQDDKKAVEEERFVYYGDGASTPLAQFGSNAPAVDVTPLALGIPTAAQLAAQGGNQQAVIGGVTFDPTTGYYKRHLRDGSNAATGTAGVEWTPDRKTLAYLKYSRGYKAFGLNTVVATAFSAFPYSKPEQMDSLEAGLKKDWTRSFQTNITAFYNLYYNAQVPLSVQQGSAPAFSIFYNVPRSILQGVELESTWRATDRLTILFTYAYLDAHVSKACCVSDPNDPTATAAGANPAGSSSQGAIDQITGLPTRGQNLAGQQLPFSPKNKIALNGNYTWSLGKYGDLIGSASYLWRDEQYSSFFNRAYNYAPSRSQIDLRLTFEDARKRFEIVGYARNLTDEHDFESTSGSRSTTGIVYQSYNLVEPRTYGVELRARF
jgi:iron complex outermembrane receptor protein